MQLATSPLWQNLLLEDPWPVGLVLFILAGVLGFVGMQQGSGRLKKIAGAAALGAVIVFLLAGLITTTRERIIEQTRTLVGHTAPLDLAAFKAMVSPQVTVLVGEGSSDPLFTGDQVFARLERALGNYPIQNQSILAIDASLRGDDFALCQFDVRSDAVRGRVTTRWLLTWKKQTDGAWQVITVQWLDSPGLIGLKADSQWLR